MGCCFSEPEPDTIQPARAVMIYGAAAPAPSAPYAYSQQQQAPYGYGQQQQAPYGYGQQVFPPVYGSLSSYQQPQQGTVSVYPVLDALQQQQQQQKPIAYSHNNI